MFVHFHVRVPSLDVANVDWHVRSALSRLFSVTAPYRSEVGQIRFLVDARGDPRKFDVGTATLSPRVEIVVRRGWGPTVELLILHHRTRCRSDAQVAMHAEAVSGAIMRCVESIQSGAAGLGGHWIAPCGWYLHLGGGSFYFERSHRDHDCSCSARWRESCAGEFSVDDSLLVFRYAYRHVWLQASAADMDAGVHEPECRRGSSIESRPPRAIESLCAKVVDAETIALSVPSAQTALLIFRRIGRPTILARTPVDAELRLDHDESR